MSIQVIISMDWEGTSLEHSNLERVKQFKSDWDIPFVHFYNPAYYTDPGHAKININKKVKRVFSKDDEIGLHLHTPRHLLWAANLSPRIGPCFSHYGDFNPGVYNGQEVMLLAYSKHELKELINYSLEKLNKNGFKNINSFRAGGWMSDEKVWEALIETGLPIESSATNSKFLDGSSWEGDNIQRYISLLWGDIQINTRPYYLQTYSGQIFEIPNNLGAIDYWNDPLIQRQIDQICAEYNTYEKLLLVINSHQETFKEHSNKLEYFLGQLEYHFGKNKIQYTTNKEIYSQELMNCA